MTTTSLLRLEHRSRARFAPDAHRRPRPSIQRINSGAYWRAPCRDLPRFATWACLNAEKLKGTGRRIPYPPPIIFSTTFQPFLRLAAHCRRLPLPTSWHEIPVEGFYPGRVPGRVQMGVGVHGLRDRGVAELSLDPANVIALVQHPVAYECRAAWYFLGGSPALLRRGCQMVS